MTDTISKAARDMARATLKVAKYDRALSERLVKALAAEMDKIQRGQ